MLDNLPLRIVEAMERRGHEIVADAYEGEGAFEAFDDR